jgi:predicted amidohydrolase
MDEIELYVRSAAGNGADLIVFPEYSCAFLALQPWKEIVEGSADMTEALGRIRSAAHGIDSLRDVFLQRAGAVDSALRASFGDLALRYGVAIVAGTAFAAETSPDGVRELRNRAYVFGRNGALLCTQDKVFLTEFERDLLGMSPGALEAARPFRIGGATVALTICRDTFHAEWERIFRGADIWIDIKANGVPFTQEQKESFGRALSSRLPGAEVRYGITACLVGKFLDFTWEGESAAVECVGGVVSILGKARSAQEPQSIMIELSL